MGVRQRFNATIHRSHEVLDRRIGGLALEDDGADRREHILNTVVEFGIQCIAMILGLLALGDVYADANHALRVPVSIIRNATTPFGPTHLTVWENDTILDA